jgi:hypothetical protein
MMHWYELALVVHFLGLIALFGFFVIYSRAGPGMRRASDMATVHFWLRLLEAARPMMLGGALMLIVSGVAMAALRWRGPYPFTVVGLVTVITIWIAGALVSGRQVRSIRAAAVAEVGPIPDDVARAVLDPSPWSTLFALNTAALGVLLVMTTKVGWLWSVAIVAGLAMIGGFIGNSLARADRERRIARAG